MTLNVSKFGVAPDSGVRWSKQIEAPASAKATAHAAPIPGGFY